MFLDAELMRLPFSYEPKDEIGLSSLIKPTVFFGHKTTPQGNVITLTPAKWGGKILCVMSL